MASSKKRTYRKKCRSGMRHSPKTKKCKTIGSCPKTLVKSPKTHNCIKKKRKSSKKRRSSKKR